MTVALVVNSQFT